MAPQSDTVVSPILPPVDDSFRLDFVQRPEEDRRLSPFTGITRAHWVAVAEELLIGAAKHRSDSGARINFPGRPSRFGVRADGLEGFSRTFLLAAFLHAGDPEVAREHLAHYREGVISGTSRGTDRPHDAWEPIGHIEGKWGQSQVEAASISLSLRLTKTEIWDKLTSGQQDDVVAWLETTLDKEPSSNNWYLFPLTTASFLQDIGRGGQLTKTVIARGLSLNEEWYRGEGWYSDGDGEAYDHYIGWAMHFYPLLHGYLSGDSALVTVLGDRLQTFLGSFAKTFDRNGASLHLGRSLTYRMGSCASIALGEIIGRTPLAHGSSRRIMSANLRYFMERGATSEGVLTLGWHGPHEPTLQEYSGPGSPYWASKGFLGLILPGDHPFWTETEGFLGGDEDDTIQSLGNIGLMIQTTKSDGLVRVHNHGSDHLKPLHADSGAPDPLYARFAYSTRTGPTPLHTPSDNDFQVSFRDIWSVRRKIHRTGHGLDWLASWHAPRFPAYAPFAASEEASGGPVLPSSRIQSVVIAHGAVDLRIHRVRHVPEDSPVRLSGWAVAGDSRDQLRHECTEDSAEVSLTNASELRSYLHGVSGWASAGISEATYGTAFGSWAAMPELHGTAGEGLFVALASLTAEPLPMTLKDCADITILGNTVTAVWADDGSTSHIDLDSLNWG